MYAIDICVCEYLKKQKRIKISSSFSVHSVYKQKAAGNALYDETFTIAAELTKDYYQRGLNFNDCNNFA